MSAPLVSARSVIAEAVGSGELADRIMKRLKEAGFSCVPIILPTAQMIAEGKDSARSERPELVWRDMVAVAMEGEEETDRAEDGCLPADDNEKSGP